jgi:hypothetical protein
MPVPQKWGNHGITMDYIDYLEKEVKKTTKRLEKVETSINLVGQWVKGETLGIYPSQIYLACIKDIRRHIK